MEAVEVVVAHHERATLRVGTGSAAGAAARTLHDAPLPPWLGWSPDEFASQLDGECE